MPSSRREHKEEELTDLPLVRKLDDGGLADGERAPPKAAYALLAEEDEKYAQSLPCHPRHHRRAVRHAAACRQYFVRSLTVTERAAASRALGVEVERMSAENRELSGVRTEDIKAAIISEQTGRKVSGKTIQRQESRAQDRGEAHAPVAQAALADALSADAVGILADLIPMRRTGSMRHGGRSPGQEGDDRVPQEVDRRARRRRRREGPAPKPAAALASALRALRRYESKAEKPAERAGQAGARRESPRRRKGSRRQNPRRSLQGACAVSSK